MHAIAFPLLSCLVRGRGGAQRADRWSLRLARAVPPPVQRLVGLDRRVARGAARAEIAAVERELRAARADPAMPRIIVQVQVGAAPRRFSARALISVCVCVCVCVCERVRERVPSGLCALQEASGNDGARRSLAAARRFEPYQL
jgi:hypothetical protein